MTDDLDRLLRDVARRDRPTPGHREELWSALQRARAPRRGVPPIWRAAAVACGVLLLSVLAWQDVGTEDFAMTAIQGSAFGESGFAHSRGKTGRAWAMDPREGVSPEELQRLAEELDQKTAAGEMTLVKVKGLTLNGIVRLTGIFRVSTSRGDDLVPVPLDDPLPVRTQLAYNEVSILFWSKYGKQVARMIEDGSAVYVGETQLMAGGYLVRCERWRLELPDLGTVVYWLGAPVP